MPLAKSRGPLQEKRSSEANLVIEHNYCEGKAKQKQWVTNFVRRFAEHASSPGCAMVSSKMSEERGAEALE